MGNGKTIPKKFFKKKRNIICKIISAVLRNELSYGKDKIIKMD
jgi:hypothetical protein